MLGCRLNSNRVVTQVIHLDARSHRLGIALLLVPLNLLHIDGRDNESKTAQTAPLLDGSWYKLLGCV